MGATLQGSSGSIELGSLAIGIGRSPENGIVVQDADASWLHAQITPQGLEHTLTDLGSKNGTFVNGQKLTPKVPCLLHNGDTLRIGNAAFGYTNTALPYPPTRTADSTPPHDPTRTGAPVSFASSGKVQTPPPPPFIRPQPQTPIPTQTAPASSRKDGDGKWGKIFAALASLATVFGVIWGVYVYLHPTPANSSPTPASNSPSIPKLHNSYNGTFTSQSTGISFNFTISSLTEDANGNFTATGSIANSIESCPATYQGSVSSDNSLHFVATTASCSGGANFSGKVFPDGHLAGTWQDQFSANQGNWTAS